MKKKVCGSCGRIIDHNKDCGCYKRTEYQKQYNEKNPQNSELRSSRWSDKRKFIIRRDGGVCQRCLIKFGKVNNHNLQVHHIKPRIKYPDLMYEDSNLICICKTCNLQLGTKEELDFEWSVRDSIFTL